MVIIIDISILICLTVFFYSLIDLFTILAKFTVYKQTLFFFLYITFELYILSEKLNDQKWGLSPVHTKEDKYNDSNNDKDIVLKIILNLK